MKFFAKITAVGIMLVAVGGAVAHAQESCVDQPGQAAVKTGSGDCLRVTHGDSLQAPAQPAPQPSPATEPAAQPSAPTRELANSGPPHVTAKLLLGLLFITIGFGLTVTTGRQPAREGASSGHAGTAPSFF